MDEDKLEKLRMRTLRDLYKPCFSASEKPQGKKAAMGLDVHRGRKKKSADRILTKEELKKFFMKFDINHDNSLSREELRKAFDDLGAWFPSYRAGRGLSHADANNDGQIDMGELNDLVNYAYELGYTVH